MLTRLKPLFFVVVVPSAHSYIAQLYWGVEMVVVEVIYRKTFKKMLVDKKNKKNIYLGSKVQTLV